MMSALVIFVLAVFCVACSTPASAKITPAIDEIIDNPAPATDPDNDDTDPPQVAPTPAPENQTPPARFTANEISLFASTVPSNAFQIISTTIQAEITANSVFVINNLAGLERFRDLVNAGLAFAGKTVYLGANINLAQSNWTPIGNDQNRSFKGVFDGCGRRISGLYFSGATVENFGLFGHINNATVRALEVANASITVSTTSWQYGRSIGVLASVASNFSQVEYITTSGSISVSTIATIGALGGVLSYAGSSTIAYCENYVNITTQSTSNVEGIAGIVGDTSGTFVINCANYGSIAGKKAVGGIKGNCQGTSMSAIADEINCVNYGEITGEQSGNYSGGGIYGSMTDYASYDQRKGANLVNIGVITNHNAFGAIAGKLGGSTASFSNLYSVLVRQEPVYKRAINATNAGGTTANNAAIAAATKYVGLTSASESGATATFAATSQAFCNELNANAVALKDEYPDILDTWELRSVMIDGVLRNVPVLQGIGANGEPVELPPPPPYDGEYQTNDRDLVWNLTTNGAVAVGDKVIFSRAGTQNEFTTNVIMYDTQTNGFSLRTNLPPAFYYGGTTVGSRVLFSGEKSGHESNSVVIYDQGTDAFTLRTGIPEAVYTRGVTIGTRIIYPTLTSTRFVIYNSSANTFTQHNLNFAINLKSPTIFGASKIIFGRDGVDNGYAIYDYTADNFTAKTVSNSNHFARFTDGIVAGSKGYFYRDENTWVCYDTATDAYTTVTTPTIPWECYNKKTEMTNYVIVPTNTNDDSTSILEFNKSTAQFKTVIGLRALYYNGTVIGDRAIFATSLSTLATNAVIYEGSTISPLTALPRGLYTTGLATPNRVIFNTNGGGRLVIMSPAV